MAVWQIGEILSVGKRATQAMGFIRGAVRAGIGANATARALREAGMGARNEDVLSVHKAYTYAYKNPSVYIRPDARMKPIQELIPLSVHNQPRSYRIVTWADTRDSVTGEITRKYITQDDEQLKPTYMYLNYGNEIHGEYEKEYEETLDVGIDSITYTDNPLIQYY